MMKPPHIILLGLILMLAGFIPLRFVPSLALGIRIILTLSYVIGLLMVIIGAMRSRRARKKESEV